MSRGAPILTEPHFPSALADPAATAATALAERLTEVFAALEKGGVRYGLLRGYDELLLPESRKEIDLLVAAEQLPALQRLLAAHGFVRWPALGHAPHYFFIGFDKGSGTWIKLDVVTALRFGRPVRALEIDLAAEMLRRRQKRGWIFTLADADAWLALFLHALLDKGQFKPDYQQRLRALWQGRGRQSAETGSIESHVARFLEPALPRDFIDQALRRGEWAALLRRGAALNTQLRKRQGGRVFRRIFSARLLRSLQPILLWRARRGLSVVLLAPDGAGKSTLAQSLARDFWFPGRIVYMGTNVDAATVGLPWTRPLHHYARALKANAGGPRLWRLLIRGLNFANRLLEQHVRLVVARLLKQRGYVVIFDRYVYDSWLVQRSGMGWNRWRRALLEAGFPKPDVVLLLDAPGEVLYARKHEHTPEWLENQRQAYLQLRRRLPQMHIIDSTAGAEAVRREALALTWERFRAHRIQDAD